MYDDLFTKLVVGEVILIVIVVVWITLSILLIHQHVVVVVWVPLLLLEMVLHVVFVVVVVI